MRVIKFKVSRLRLPAFRDALCDLNAAGHEFMWKEDWRPFSRRFTFMAGDDAMYAIWAAFLRVSADEIVRPVKP